MSRRSKTATIDCNWLWMVPHLASGVLIQRPATSKTTRGIGAFTGTAWRPHPRHLRRLDTSYIRTICRSWTVHLQRRLALAAAEGSAVEAQLCERISGNDRTLLKLACRLAAEGTTEHAQGLRLWNATANDFIDRLVLAHTRVPDASPRGRLGLDVLGKIRDYVHANLAEPIEVNELASLAGRSPFHFTRIFARSIGVTPYRYVVHLRLQAAIDRIRSGMSLAQVAADTGFSDQSHLSRWIRRVHGVPPSELA